MNTIITSKEAILDICRGMIASDGLAAINMRAVAKACDVALGTLYYYFLSKDDLLIAAIESVWKHIFGVGRLDATKLPFPDYIAGWFQGFLRGMEEYPNFFTMHSLSFAGAEQTKARQTMHTHLEKLHQDLLQCLKLDSGVRKGCFSASFSQTDFVNFVMSHLMVTLVQQKKDCQTLLEVIRRVIY